MNIVTFFIILQIIVLIIIALHDWIDVPPFTDIHALKKLHSFKQRLFASTLYALIVGYPLLLTCFYQPNFPCWVLVSIALCYGLLTSGTILSWWIPYFFGSSAAHKEGFAEYRNTHHFLPSRGDNVVPNTFHVIMHVLIWACFAIAFYLIWINF